MSKLLAPNGKPSNLTPEQYKLVRSKEFISWFGDWEKDPANASKVLDENGEPLVVYRGMPKKRRFGNIFNYNVNLFIENRKKNKFAFYFSRTKEEAEIYGFQSAEYNDDDYIVKEYFLKINNLFLAVKKDSVASKSKININSSRPNRFNLYDKPIPEIDKELGKGYLTFKELFDLAKPNKKDFELLNTEYTDNEDAKKEYEEEQERVSAKPIYWHFIDISKNDKKQDFWRNYLKDIKKYDGLMFYEDTHALTFTGRGKNEKAILQFLDNPNTICVFEPNQIKLADGTNTTFDGNNPDIRFDEGGNIDEFYIGKTYSGKQVRDIVSKYESQEGTDMEGFAVSHIKIKDKYILDYVEIERLIQNDSSLHTFITDQYNPNNDVDYEDIRQPILLGTDEYRKQKNIVLDGYHRILQQLYNKESKIFAFIPFNSSDIRFDEGGEIDGFAQQLIDIISSNPQLEKYQKYKVILKDKFGIDFDDFYKDDYYIENANLLEIKDKDDFLNYDKYIEYAYKIFRLRGLIKDSHAQNIEGTVSIDKAIEIGTKLNFIVKHKEYDGGSDNYASHSIDTITIPNKVDINTFIHEIGHHYDHFESKEYKGLAKTSTYASSLYEIGKSDEVFAENFKNYFVAPNWLKEKLPMVYNELDKNINDVYKEEIYKLINSSKEIYRLGGEVNTGLFSQIWEWFGIKF